MNTNHPLNDLLTISVTLSASPELFMVRQNAGPGSGMDLLSYLKRKEFDLQVGVAVPYEGLSAIAGGWLGGKRFEVAEGFFGSHMIVQKVNVSSDPGGLLAVRVQFTGSFNGTIIFTGKPVINMATKRVELSGLQYHIETSSFLLNTAKWLFPSKILKEIAPYTSMDISKYLDKALGRIQELLNTSWAPGISATGSLEELDMSAQPQPQQLLVTIYSKGKLRVTITEEDLLVKP